MNHDGSLSCPNGSVFHPSSFKPSFGTVAGPPKCVKITEDQVISMKSVRRLLSRLRFRSAFAACVLVLSCAVLPRPAKADLFADKSDLFLKNDIKSLSLLTPEPVIIQLN